MTSNHPQVVHIALGIVLTVLALNAFGGGWYGMAGAEGIPLEWLHGSPFQSYFLPSLILFVVVGGSFLFAAIAVFRRTRFAGTAATCSVVIVFFWLAVQLFIIGYVSWMQPATAIAGLLALALARKLSGSSVHPNSSAEYP
jgi:hypothetical protein